MTSATHRFDLDAYLERIRYLDAVRPDLTTLEGLHRAHLDRIPFENIDVRLRRPISLELGDLEAKLVHGARGGYCFEQNTLLAAALRAAGFEVATLEARVRPAGATAVLARTHMLLEVTVNGRAWLADVGFGGDGPLLPVPLDGTPSEQTDGRYAVQQEGGGLAVLRRRWRGAWSDLYAFCLTPALPVDFEMANHFTSTFPRSAFLRTLTVQRSLPHVRHILRGRTYTIRRGETEQVREIAAAELPALLECDFGLRVSPRDALRALGVD